MLEDFNDIEPRGLDQIPLKKKEYPFINKTKGISMLPIDDFQDAVLMLCDFANDIYNKSTILGFADNLPGVLKALEGYENILPQAIDMDAVEKDDTKAKIMERLTLTEGAELITDKAIDALYAITELVKAIDEAKKTPEA